MLARLSSTSSPHHNHNFGVDAESLFEPAKTSRVLLFSAYLFRNPGRCRLFVRKARLFVSFSFPGPAPPDPRSSDPRRTATAPLLSGPREKIAQVHIPGLRISRYKYRLYLQAPQVSCWLFSLPIRSWPRCPGRGSWPGLPTFRPSQHNPDFRITVPHPKVCIPRSAILNDFLGQALGIHDASSECLLSPD